MCGICGLALGRDAPNPDALAAMSAALRHRGPDSDGMVVDGPVGLAARRLAIIDLAGGDQPIANEDGRLQVVQNGEIYNHRELRSKLARSGHRFSTSADTEVLVHLYEERGPRFVKELRGMFAIALWDSRERMLMLARDPFGIKPLYYRSDGPDLAFASELKALRRLPGAPLDVDLDALDAYLTFNSIPAPLTIYRQARKLPPGHLLIWRDGQVELERYSSPRPAPKGEVREESAGDLARELRERLRDSVRAHLVSDVPVGVMLSGGVDSSVLAGLAAGQTGGRLKTFSIGFQERSFNELDNARLVAERYGTDHHELLLRPDAAQLLPEIVDAFDEPYADSSALPTYLVSRLAAEHVKVALSGEGGDELFGGYYTYVADLLAARFGRPASALRPLVERLPSSSGRTSLDYMAKRFVGGAALPPLEAHHAWKEIFAADARAELLGDRARSSFDPLEVYRERYAGTADAEPLARMQDVDLGIYLVDDLLVKTDRASMAHSLEVRVPFLDPVVAELALALPTRHKVRGFSKKRLLRRAASELVPRRIVHGRKRGFSIPAAAWLRGELEPFAREVLSPAALERQGYLSPQAVTRILDEHVEGRRDASRQIWGLLCFSLWLERHGSVAPAPAGVAG